MTRTVEIWFTDLTSSAQKEVLKLYGRDYDELSTAINPLFILDFEVDDYEPKFEKDARAKYEALSRLKAIADTKYAWNFSPIEIILWLFVIVSVIVSLIILLFHLGCYINT